MNIPASDHPIKTNQLSYTLNRDEIDKKYDIFCIATTDEYFKRGALIIDAPFLDNKVCSVRFDDGSCFYAMMNRSQDNKKILTGILENTEEFSKITIAQMKSSGIPDHILLQLLLNSMGTYNRKSLSFNNLTGHFYCYHPKWLSHLKNGSKSVVCKVPCMKLTITPDCQLLNSVHTFTSEILKNHIKFEKKKFEDYTKYVLSAHNTLRRKLKGDSGTTFIMRQTEGDKTEIPFLRLGTLSGFESCKIGVISSVLDSFNSKFEGIAHMEFAEIPDYIALEYDCTTLSENKKVIRNYLQSMHVNIIDCIGTEESFDFCSKVSELLLEKYEVTAFLDNKVLPNHLNIRLIHDADYYKSNKIEDPHNQVFDGCTVQHITFEKFFDSCEFAISTVVHELLIKRDLLAERMSLFDWSQLNLDGDMTFGLRPSKEENKFYFMRIHPDGSFSFSKEYLDLFETNEYSDCIIALYDATEQDNKAVGVIKDASGNINVISDTSLYTLPQYRKIREELQAKSNLATGKSVSRKKENRDELLTSCLDIKYFVDNGTAYYFAGVIGAGMNVTLHRAANVRKVEVFDGSELFFSDLLRLMHVTFVRNMQLTVIPFPFKYIREHINLSESEK